MDPAQHLKPLSKYTVTLLNKCTRKRSLDQSSPESHNETPTKRLFSPDFGCVLDDPSPPEKRIRTCSRVFSPSELTSPNLKFDFSVENMFSTSPFEEDEPEEEADGGYSSMSCRVTGSEPRCQNWSVSPIKSLRLESEPGELWDIGVPLLESSNCIDTPHKTKAAATFDSTLEGPQPLLERIHSVPQSPVKASPHSQEVLTEVRVNNGINLLPVRQPRRKGYSTDFFYKYLTWFFGVVKFRTEEQWNVSMMMYTNSVYNHVGSSNGVDELNHLMRYVAHQTNGGRWQHPSDLSCRNHARRFGIQTPKRTLAEWASSTYKRFEGVPKLFERSPLP